MVAIPACAVGKCIEKTVQPVVADGLPSTEMIERQSPSVPRAREARRETRIGVGCVGECGIAQRQPNIRVEHHHEREAQRLAVCPVHQLLNDCRPVAKVAKIGQRICRCVARSIGPRLVEHDRAESCDVARNGFAVAELTQQDELRPEPLVARYREHALDFVREFLLDQRAGTIFAPLEHLVVILGDLDRLQQCSRCFGRQFVCVPVIDDGKRISADHGLGELRIGRQPAP